MVWTRGKMIAAGVAAAVVLVGLGIGLGRSGKSEAPAPIVAPPTPPHLPTGKAGKLPDEVQREVEAYARGAMLHVFFHETGHMLIGELKIPATGPEEDVADEFATFILAGALQAAPDDQKGIFAMLMWAGIEHWRLLAQGREKRQGGIAWFDEHSPDLRRYYSVMCLATGADPVRFIPMAVKAGVPQERLLRCADEYKTKRAAWEKLMQPYAPGFVGRTFGTHQMKLTVGPAGKSEWLAFENTYKQGGFFEQMLKSISDSVELPRDIPVKVQACNQLNAWYSPSDHTITLCHDYFEHLVEVFAESAQRQMAAAAAKQGGGQGQPAPQPQGGGQPMPQPGGGQPMPMPPGGPSLAGNWTCQGNSLGMMTQEQITLAPDGSFRSVVFFPQTGQSIQSWGRWSVNGSVLRYDIAGSNSPQPIPSPILVPIQMPAPNVIQTQTATCQRVG